MLYSVIIPAGWSNMRTLEFKHSAVWSCVWNLYSLFCKLQGWRSSKPHSLIEVHCADASLCTSNLSDPSTRVT